MHVHVKAQIPHMTIWPRQVPPYQFLVWLNSQSILFFLSDIYQIILKFRVASLQIPFKSPPPPLPANLIG